MPGASPGWIRILEVISQRLIQKGHLMRERNPDPTIAEMELECLERINKDGKGPMGLGGRTTALDVKMLKMDTHTAGLPVGVVIQCWADRHATARLEDN